MNDLKAKLENVNARMQRACRNPDRPAGEVRLLAVSKGQSAAKIRRLSGAGQLAFGENYVQEALAKQAELGDLRLEWHFIGPIQSNKTADIASHFDWVQSADRDRVLRRLSAQRPDELAPLNVCLQVNIDREPQKSGVLEEGVEPLAELTSSLPRLRLRGLMAIPRAAENGHDPLPSFRALRRLFDRLGRSGFGLDTLSMGMSADLELAIEAGSTLVRVGTDLFGPRIAD